MPTSLLLKSDHLSPTSKFSPVSGATGFPCSIGREPLRIERSAPVEVGGSARQKLVSDSHSRRERIFREIPAGLIRAERKGNIEVRIVIANTCRERDVLEELYLVLQIDTQIAVSLFAAHLGTVDVGGQRVIVWREDIELDRVRVLGGKVLGRASIVDSEQHKVIERASPEREIGWQYLFANRSNYPLLDIPGGSECGRLR